MEDLKGKLIGGAIVLVLGGTGFAISQTDVINNFASETGMSQEEAKQYADDIQDDLESFTNVGQSFIDDGNSILAEQKDIDCVNYTYDWESADLTCQQGKDHIEVVGNQEITLGECYKKLDQDLGSAAISQTKTCIVDIDKLNTSYNKPASSAIWGKEFVDESVKSNLYTKSVLKAAVES